MKMREILAAVSAGASVIWASKYVSVDVNTIRDECNRNPTFKASMEKAAATSYMRHLGNVCQAGDSDWKASAWLLERQHRDEFGKKEEIENKGEVIIRTVFDRDFFTKRTTERDDVIEAGEPPKRIESNGEHRNGEA